ncbi:MAG: alanine--tRNA ligase [Porphyromonadaceae bacterium]|uniref:alanine--tRNA ligase n=1 Tax=Porphyromonas sp. TaxID=1924944 RepID=UPI001CAF93A6|nr:alanine--tRNA ligase [Porphyromonas sp.]MBF1315666.1 alanine--tRNA ligase [Porphyromonadaceae bacterium]MBF1366420.1 alanine--tRNA ligase [Porphyromonadaceae bacterium]MBF1390366.1 alanine--tRNA ligase [Porphyromonas sp.]
MTSKEIRESYKSFFQSKGHTIVPSAPMVVKGDPTLMFTNAGMNQFKDIILGNAEIKHSRVADSQKCLRVSGKHNDLEEVGHDTYHHTMFEMLGNWSFGDYFKHEAIDWAWEYLTEVLHLSPERLYVTVFEGAPAEGLERDDEAASIWAKHLPAERIINGNKHDNFWEMGDQGPCGPCSEIHIDIRSDEERKAVDGLTLVNQSHPQVIEIWNLVFMQYNRKADGSLEPLPKRVIDTGMGFERLCMAMQGKTSNYDTDIFTPMIQAIATLTGIEYGADQKSDVAMRVIADHIRTIAFAITDGQLPSNAKAGYVIRRILRRAVRYGYTFLGRREAFMYSLLPVLIETMGDAYPELIAGRELIAKVMREEEESFLRTLETGIRLLDKQIEEAKKAGKTVLDGHDAFVLYDTYGFPLDLTALILTEQGLSVDEAGFDKAMQEQKERARNAAAIDAGDWQVVNDGSAVRFVGYDTLECTTEILRYREVKQKNATFYQVVLSETPFYAEMGGQVGDKGFLIATDGTKYEVFDTKRENNLAIHLMKKLPATLEGDFRAVVDEERRHRIEANHSATHLLHEALREVLGSHVEQKGSFVSDEVLRFDFAHFAKVEPEQLRAVERIVAARIRACIPLQEYREVPIDEAREMGAMALFGEKYGDHVRVIRFGSSTEFCGGTHVASTGVIGTLRITSESSVAAGVRRIEAVTGAAAENYLYEQADMIDAIRQLFNNSPQLKTAIRKTLEENAELGKQVGEYIREQIAEKKRQLLEKRVEVGGVRLFLVEREAPAEIVKDIAFQIAGELHEPFVFIAACVEPSSSKPSLTLMISKDLVESRGWNASQLLRAAAKHIQGGGGGQPHFATAGGKNADGLNAAVEELLTAMELKA